MSEVRFQAESALIEQQKKKQTDNTQVGNNKPSGIDFKNDTVLVAAKASFMDAQAVENSRLLDKTSASIELTHTESDISVLLGEFQNLVNQLSQAQAQSESLSSRNQSVLEQLAAQNETVNNLTGERAASAGAINNLSTQISSRSATRLSVEGRKSAAEGRKSTVQASIDSIDKDIAALRDSITEDMTDEQKAEIEKQIAEKEAQKPTAELNAAEQEIEAAQGELDRLDEEIRQLSTQKSEEEANFRNIEAQLAEAIMVQTGLTLQQASLTALLKESQAYETNLGIQLDQVEEKIAAKEAEKEEKQKDVDKATEKADKASDDVKEKKSAYSQEESAAKARAEQEEQQNIFMA